MRGALCAYALVGSLNLALFWRDLVPFGPGTMPAVRVPVF